MKIPNFVKVRLAEFLDINLNEDRDIPLFCPYPSHENTDTKAFSINIVKGVFNCFGCHEGGDLNKLYTDLFNEIVEDEIDFGEPIKSFDDLDVDYNEQIANKVNALAQMRQDLADFIESRKISVETLNLLKHFVVIDPSKQDFGYIKFKHDKKDIYTSRKFFSLLPEDRPKYLDIKSSDKSILGLTMLNRKLNYLIMVEGLYDWFTLKELGVENVVCSYGSNVAPKQAYDVVGYCSKVYILFDNDFAGFDGSKKLIKTLLEFGIRGIAIRMPVELGNDANEALCNGFGDDLVNWINGVLSMESNYDVENFDQVTWLKEHFNKDVKPMDCYPTGLKGLDDLLLGGYREGLHCISGNTSVGKTSFAIFLMMQFIKHNPNKKALYVTYEISDVQVWSRIASMISTKSWAEIESNPAQLEENKTQLLYALGTAVNVMQSLTMQEIGRAFENVDLVVIDYLQKVPPLGLFDTKNDAYSASADYILKKALLHHKLAFILSSKSKSSYKDLTGDSGLKGSGDIEYSCGSILHLSRYRETEIDLIKATFSKNTRGRLDEIYLKANFEHIMFQEYEPLIERG